MNEKTLDYLTERLKETELKLEVATTSYMWWRNEAFKLTANEQEKLALSQKAVENMIYA